VIFKTTPICKNQTFSSQLVKKAQAIAESQVIRAALENHCELLKTPHSADHPVDVLCSPADATAYLASITGSVQCS
jgi:hypothetical protein